MSLWMGIDAGGSGCRVRIENEYGTLLGTGEAGSGHPIHGIEVVASNILQATNQALAAANLPYSAIKELIVGGGYAGLHLERFERVIADWRHPFSAHHYCTDLDTACLGAHQGKDGAVIILGTGFSALARVKGKQHSIGGQGFLLGDRASGAWFGLQAVKRVLAYWEGLEADSSLVESVQQACEADKSTLADIMLAAAPNVFARLAPLVFDAAEQGDEVALNIRQQALDDIQQVIQSLLDFGAEQIVMHGSVGRRLLDSLPEQFRSCFVSAAMSPEQGAIIYAKQQIQLNSL